MSNSVIDAAFCSSKVNECYIFVKNKYVIVDYTPGSIKKDIINGPARIVDGFPMFAKTQFQHRIDSSFDTDDNVQFVFSGNQCAKTTIKDRVATLIQGPIPIYAMFPCLKGTIFEDGIDATMRTSNGKWVHLFKGDEYGTLDFNRNTLSNRKKIGKAFKSFLGTVFEEGIDAAFNSHATNEVYIFKGRYYAQYDLTNGKFLNGFIKVISVNWPALQSILS